eukprot:TRINITY_DN12539_c0_g1_i1.p1 TRINITY_DN12539_c0_g1~~TRINITY_DN12539_c0_g1_i1.p1  ORF type:complete len:150 (-),score=34.19 TRINITY_DN12539_c0_g1_i1:108-557(-)
MAYTTKDVPEYTVAFIRKTEDADSLGPFVSSSAISLLVYAKEKNLEIAEKGFVIFHSFGEKVDLEVCLPVTQISEGRGDIQFRVVKGGKGFSSVYHGSYDGLLEHQHVVIEEAKKQGFNHNEIRIVYLKTPQQTKDASQYETEVLLVQS